MSNRNWSNMFNIIKKLFKFNVCPNKFLPMTQFFVIVNIFIFILQVLYPSITETYVYRADCWYSYVTACFLHGSLSHLVGNMLFLSFIFPVIEEKYGSFFIFIAYIFTGVCGGLLTALVTPNSMGLGASGSIMGVMMLWIFHNLIYGRPFLVMAAVFYFMKEGISSGISIFYPDGVGHLVHYGSSLGAFFLLPYLIYKGNKHESN